MSVDYSVFIMIGASRLAPILDHMIFSMPILYSQHLKKGIVINFENKNCKHRSFLNPYPGDFLYLDSGAT